MTRGGYNVMRRAILLVLPVLLIFAVFAPAYIEKYGLKTTMWYFPAMLIVVAIGLVAGLIIGLIIRGRRT
jgi:cytochrome bd-type quinol oxidase subunit 2